MTVVVKDKIEYIFAMLKNLEYGSLVITIHEGHVTQIDSTVKNRFVTKNPSINKKSF